MRCIQLAIVLISFLAAGFASTIKQSISGVVKSHGSPLPGVSLKLVQDNGPNVCSNAGELLETDQNGTFHAAISAQRSSIAVIVQPLSLCEKEGEAWALVWQSLHGPAPDAIKLECTKNENSSTTCRATFN